MGRAGAAIAGAKAAERHVEAQIGGQQPRQQVTFPSVRNGERADVDGIGRQVIHMPAVGFLCPEMATEPGPQAARPARAAGIDIKTGAETPTGEARDGER